MANPTNEHMTCSGFVKPKRFTSRQGLRKGAVMIGRCCIFPLVGILLSAQDAERRGVNFYNKDKEAALGSKLAADLRKHTSAITDSTVNDYIERLGRQLAAQAPGGDVNWEFMVIRDEVGGSTHEAISIPG